MRRKSSEVRTDVSVWKLWRFCVNGGNYPFRTSVFPFVQSNLLGSARLATTQTQPLICS
jgi:hypothetical protein